jgi:hypothetical protein
MILIIWFMDSKWCDIGYRGCDFIVRLVIPVKAVKVDLVIGPV